MKKCVKKMSEGGKEKNNLAGCILYRFLIMYYVDFFTCGK